MIVPPAIDVAALAWALGPPLVGGGLAYVLLEPERVRRRRARRRIRAARRARAAGVRRRARG